MTEVVNSTNEAIRFLEMTFQVKAELLVQVQVELVGNPRKPLHRMPTVSILVAREHVLLQLAHILSHRLADGAAHIRKSGGHLFSDCLVRSYDNATAARCATDIDGTGTDLRELDGNVMLAGKLGGQDGLCEDPKFSSASAPKSQH
jgi:hypothetical protein